MNREEAKTCPTCGSTNPAVKLCGGGLGAKCPHGHADCTDPWHSSPSPAPATAILCKFCGKEIKSCDTVPCPAGNGWVHVGVPKSGSHYCGDNTQLAAPAAPVQVQEATIRGNIQAGPSAEPEGERMPQLIKGLDPEDTLRKIIREYFSGEGRERAIGVEDIITVAMRFNRYLVKQRNQLIDERDAFRAEQQARLNKRNSRSSEGSAASPQRTEPRMTAKQFYEPWRIKKFAGLDIPGWPYLYHSDVCDFAEAYAEHVRSQEGK